MAQVKKLSVKTVWGGIAATDYAARTHVARFVGLVSGMKTVATNFGDATAFLGDLRGIHPRTGEVSKAATLYLPDIAAEPLAAALAASEGRPVQLGVDVFVQKSAGNRAGGSPYEYSIDEVFPAAADDPVAKMMETAAKARPLAIASTPAAPQIDIYHEFKREAPEPQTEVTPAKKGKGK